ncbi:MAG: discoidin domain-containing protein, partial [Actinobacteria bacterium]|nr:discoidin domain-containing protein [Actinomycetota bacterium]
RVPVGDGPPIDVRLDDSSLTPEGQEITFPARTADHVDIELIATSTPRFDPARANAVGFAEVRIGDLVVAETVRMPLDLLDRAGDRGAHLPLSLVMTRLRTSPDRWQRGDDEHRLDRTFTLPDGRTFTIDGTVRLDDDAPDHLLDQVLGTGGSTRVDASSRLQGVPAARASRALDDDPATAWTAAFGSGTGTWIELDADAPATVDHVTLSVVADGLHSVPRTVTVLADGKAVATRDVGPVAEGPGARSDVTIDLDQPVRTDRLRIVVDDIDPRRAPGADPGEPPLPVAIAEITGTGFATVPTSGTVDDTCREDLLTLDEEPVPVKVQGPLDDGTLRLSGCEPVTTGSGTHRVVAAEGSTSGLDLDQLTWRSTGDDTDPVLDGDRDGPIEPVDPPATVERVDAGRTSVAVDLRADGDPFWFVLGQSASAGWEIEVDGATAGRRTVVDGYADGWYLTPDGAGPIHIELRWTPQRTVLVGMAISAIAVVASIVVLLRSKRGSPPPPLPRPSLLPRSTDLTAGTWTDAAVTGALTAAAVALASRPWIGLVCGLLAAAVSRRPVVAWSAAALGPAALTAARLLDRPELGWLALGILVAAVVPDVIRTRGRPTASP